MDALDLESLAISRTARKLVRKVVAGTAGFSAVIEVVVASVGKTSTTCELT